LITRKLVSIATAFALLATVGAQCGYSAPVIWKLQNVVFDDGGKAGGSFAFDAATGKITDWNITATGHGADVFGTPIDIQFVNAQPCDPADCSSAEHISSTTPAVESFIFDTGQTPSNSGFLSLVTSGPLSDAGGTVQLFRADVPNGSYFSCCESLVETVVTSGSLASIVPEPATWIALSLGIIMSLQAKRHLRRAAGDVPNKRFSVEVG